MKEVDFEKIAVSTRAEALELVELEIAENPDNFKNWSEMEFDLYRKLGGIRKVREAELYAPLVQKCITDVRRMKERGINVFAEMYDMAQARVLFILKGERYTTETRSDLCALMEVSEGCYCNTLERYGQILDEEISDDITNTTINDVIAEEDKELSSLNRLLTSMDFIGLSCVWDWANHTATDEQRQTINNAIKGAKAFHTGDRWYDVDILKWYTSLTPDERVGFGCVAGY